MPDPILDLIRRCQTHRESKKKEKMVREEFVSYLRAVFPGETWVDHFIEGAEAAVATGRTATGRRAVGFVDTLVRATALEYEKDIRVAAIRDTGLAQLRKYTAAMIAAGTAVDQIRAVLSDFVEWEVYEPTCTKAGDPTLITEADIDLGKPVDGIDTSRLASGDEGNYLAFLRAHLAREESRQLTSSHLATDFGFRSGSFAAFQPELKTIVERAVASDTSAAVATSLWAKFIDHLESGGTDFRASHYAAELYFCLLARLLAANVLVGHALRDDDTALEAIISGEFFHQQFRLGNFVERDYFGWIARKAHLKAVLPVVRKLQRDLAAYNYQETPRSELFGPLIGQLAEETQRHLLGQANTPSWLARQVAERCLSELAQDEQPQFADMCCGSGSIMCEVINAYRSRNPTATLGEIVEAVTGFDVDPLAVTFAKTTWVITAKDLLLAASKTVNIPVYHADSLFVVTPTSKGFPRAEGAGEIEVELDGKIVKLPAVLIEPEFRRVFDDLIDWAYDNAIQADEAKSLAHITAELAARRLDAALTAAGVTLDTAIHDKACSGLHKLARRMAEIAVDGRNGIWAFVLKNTYRPSLLAGQFNGIVSNPPWLTLSRIRNNPYKERITSRTQSYGLKPQAQSFLHLEIATTFLMYAVDRYLKTGGIVGVIVPATILNGDHHEPFRNQAYLRADRPVPLNIDEFWVIGNETFNIPGAVVIGSKLPDVKSVGRTRAKGFLATERGLQASTFSGGATGQRTAWAVGAGSSGGTLPVAADHAEPQQGADLMPRRAVAVTILDATGAEYKVRTPQPEDPESYVVGAAKEFKTLKFNGYVAPRFLFRMLQSLSVVPFAIDTQLPPIAVPAVRNMGGRIALLEDTEIQADGFRDTAKRFRAINKAYADGKDNTFRGYLNTRNKLTNQLLPSRGFLVVHPASGSNAAAAVLRLSAKHADLLIDQTLYWYVTQSEDAAYFLAGVLNSRAVAEMIDPFVPEGKFGNRHFHARPWQVIPGYAAADPNHSKIADLAKKLSLTVDSFVAADPVLRDPAKWIKTGRKRVLTFLRGAPEMDELSKLSAVVL